MITTTVPVQAFMSGLAIGLATFFVACLLLLGAAVIRHLSSAPFDEN